MTIARNVRDGTMGRRDVGTPAEAITDPDSVLYPVAQEADPEDLLRAEIYPSGQNVIMTEAGDITFLGGVKIMLWRLWRGGIAQLPLRYHTSDGDAGTLTSINRRRK